jgi:flagellar basal-body rod modification protein FlgD
VGISNNIINPNTGVNAGSAVQDKTKLGKEDFMKLLIAQLKNQDPNSPVDAKEFVTQLSQLTSVEQLTNMSNELKNLQLATTSMVNNQATGFIGKTIEANGSKLYLGASGGASSGINLAQAAAKVTISIRDANGTVVRTQELPTGAKQGVSSYTWDGFNDAGERAPAAQYSMTVEAKNGAGDPVIASAEIKGVVSKITYEQGFPELVVGEARVALANVTTIKQ